MKKTYILDTNVLIHDPESIFNFQDNVVVIPYPVLEELDNLKKSPNGKAYSARKVIRYIDNLISDTKAKKYSYGYQIPLLNDGILILTSNWKETRDLPPYYDSTILGYAKQISRDPLGKAFPQPVVLVTKDVSFRIIASLQGLLVEDYKTDKTQSYRKYGEIEKNATEIGSLHYFENNKELYKVKKGETFKVKPKSLFSIFPKTQEQICTIDALLDTDIDLVVLNGCAGTGKTLLALASGILQTIKGIYEKVVVIRPIIPIPGTDIGYLPGDVKEKLLPWMQPIYDNLELISQSFSSQPKKDKEKPTTNLSDLVQIQALTFIRGRSLPNCFIIIDEAQNLRPLDIKTIVTRAGEGSKIVFTGDLEQIDTPYLDANSSGIAYLIDKFINEDNFCYLNLKQTVRSRLAEQGVRLL